MSQVAQMSKAINMLLVSLPDDEQQLIMQQLIQDLGIGTGVPQMYLDKQVADRYQVNVRTVRKWMANGKLKHCKINGRWYSRADWLLEYEDAKATATA